MSQTFDMEPVADVVIGNRIAHIMWLEDVTQIDMAKSMRMDQATLSRKLRGERKWSAAEIVRAAKVLRIRIAWLFGEAAEARPLEDEDDVRLGGSPEPLTRWSVLWRRLLARCRDSGGDTGPAAGVETPPLTMSRPAPRKQADWVLAA
jgi:transcriptional regulator with XRE-family HTH domain